MLDYLFVDLAIQFLSVADPYQPITNQLDLRRDDIGGMGLTSRLLCQYLSWMDPGQADVHCNRIPNDTQW